MLGLTLCLVFDSMVNQHCVWCLMYVVGTIMCGTGTTVSANAPSHRSITRGFSIAAAINCNDLHLFSRNEPLQKVCTELEKPA